jgi:hypothetical protein
MPIKRYLPALSWSIAALLALAAAIFGLYQDLPQNPGWWSLILMALLPVVPLCWKASRAVTELASPWRVLFWIITLAGGAACVWLLDWQADNAYFSSRSGHTLAAVSAILPILVAALLWVRQRRTAQPAIAPKNRAWLDAGYAVASLAALTCIAWFLLAKIYVPHVCRVTEARWAAIGRPMPEFEQRIHPIQENSSIRELTGDLAAFGFKSFYKSRFGEQNPNTLKMPAGVIDLITTMPSAKEDLIPSITPAAGDSVSKGAVYLNSRADDFNRLYQDVLRRDPPVWAYNPAEGPQTRMPNYLAARQLTQLILGDACLKLQRGDVEAAAVAASADLRLWSNISEQPTMISSVWNHSMLETALQNVLVRLPEDPNGLKNLASDVQSEREKMRTAIQAGYYQWVNFPDSTAWQSLERNPANQSAGLSPIRPLREWLTDLFGRPLFKLQAARDWQIGAAQVAITQRSPELASTDLGVAEMEASENRHGQLLPYLERAWLQANFHLLLREQIELIRSARTQMIAGKTGNLGDWQSLVIPGSKWKITGDAATNSVSLKLTPIPRWVAERAVIGPDFFLLPVDGSKSWKFAPAPQRTVADAR